MSKEILEATRALAREKGIASEKLFVALEDALLSAYKKQPGSAKYARVEMDRETADFSVIELIIPERLEAHLIVETIDEGTTVDPETGRCASPRTPEIDPEKFAEYEDQIEARDVTPDDFGRIAAQTAKQVILQRIREAERDMMFEEYRDRVGELITGIVQQSDSRYTLVQLRERVEALLPKSEQVEGERYDHSQRIKAVIKEVSASTKGPQHHRLAARPRADQEAVRARGPGDRRRPRRDRQRRARAGLPLQDRRDLARRRRRPGGRLRRPRGSRVRMVVSELRGEKIDIIPYNDEPARFVAKALSPARVREVLVDDDGQQATVIVPDDQLSLAIGREGQNARLAARLTGWRVDIKSETEFSSEEAERGFEEEDVGGRCAAILANGRRCPNAALPGSRYCGLPETHQALADKDTDQVDGRSRRPAAARRGPAEEPGCVPPQPVRPASPGSDGARRRPARAPDAAPRRRSRFVARAEAAGRARARRYHRDGACRRREASPAHETGPRAASRLLESPDGQETRTRDREGSGGHQQGAAGRAPRPPASRRRPPRPRSRRPTP